MGGLGILIIMFLMGLIMLALIAAAAILVGIFFTSLIGGIVLVLTGKHFSGNAKRKLISRICFIVGAILLILAGSSIGVLYEIVAKLFV
ncbi:hypothetical protein [Butyrivibrio sp. NC3005]|uniref:hypothetical protein n=1 Tax=Butyrivibrio sp. NC3005 TaxID=1280685 RepID=UPI0003F7FD6B|nr:hypothetical protein [Butyrivibrio sp. NC3005]